MQTSVATYKHTNPAVFYGGAFCGYDNMHNITSKKQHIAQTDVAFEGELLAGYELEYNYRSDKPHQLESIKDNNYRTADSTAVESSIKNLQDAYTYDSNGNLLFVNTADSVQTNIKERQLSWDEENRLRSICDNGYISSYFYDAGGARTVKLHGSGEGIHVNSAFSGGYTNNVDYTLYVDAYMVLEKGGQYTKHIYIGDQRIVSKLGDVGSFGVDPRREQYAGEDVAGVEVPDYKTKYEALQNVIKGNYQLFEVDYYGVDNDNYVDGAGFCCEPKAQAKNARSLPTENVDYEKLQYYYHSDHLGSASYITNLDGEVVQHIEYVPFGEVFLEERNNTWNTPFLFNGKELDEETGLYYYGARYYNPRISLWYGVDPLAEKYPNVSPYCYTLNSPIMLVDPDGRWVPEIRNGQISLVAESGDNRESLMKFFGSEKRAQKYLKEYAMKEIPWIKGQEAVFNDENIFSKAVKDAYENTEKYSYPNSREESDATANYNCHKQAIEAAKGNEFHNSSTMTEDNRNDIINNQFKRLNNEGDAMFGHTVVTYNVSHSATFFGKSNDGTVFVFSKNGPNTSPIISQASNPSGDSWGYGPVSNIETTRKDAAKTDTNLDPKTGRSLSYNLGLGMYNLNGNSNE